MSVVLPPALDAGTGGGRWQDRGRPVHNEHRPARPRCLVVGRRYVRGDVFCSPGFFSVAHTQELLAQASVLGMLAISQTFVLLVGGVDLSVPWTMTMAAIITNSLAPSTGLAAAMAIALAASVGVGAVNGLGVSLLGMSPIVMTLAMNGIINGAVSSIVGGTGFINSPTSLVSFTSGIFLGIPNVVWVWVGLGVIAIGVLRGTVFGRSLYATGSSQRVAWLSGIRWRPVVTGCYVVSSLVAGLTGVLLAGTLVPNVPWDGRRLPFPVHRRRSTGWRGYQRWFGRLRRSPRRGTGDHCARFPAVRPGIVRSGAGSRLRRRPPRGHSRAQSNRDVSWLSLKAKCRS